MFSNLMEDIFENDKEDRLEVRHFLTSASLDDRDLGNVIFAHACKMVHKSNGMDILLGHRVRRQVELGRPQWDVEMARVVNGARQIGETKAGVFLCGPMPMADAVQAACLNETSKDFKLLFHKETF